MIHNYMTHLVFQPTMASNSWNSSAQENIKKTGEVHWEKTWLNLYGHSWMKNQKPWSPCFPCSCAWASQRCNSVEQKLLFSISTKLLCIWQKKKERKKWVRCFSPRKIPNETPIDTRGILVLYERSFRIFVPN